jgi:hypothetical protein
MNQFEQELHDELRRSEQGIEPDTARRLSLNRSKAISQGTHQSHWWSQLTLTRGVALASVLAFAVVLYPGVVGNQFSSTASGNYLSNDGDDLYENIDFYLWMANSENNLAG